MTIEKVVCDECGRVKAESNHWHEIGVLRHKEHRSKISVVLGDRAAMDPGDDWDYSMRDICGEQCFHRHIAMLLGFNPRPELKEEAEPGGQA